MKLVVEREREIRAFIPEEYWDLFADLSREGETTPVRFQVSREGGAAFRPHTKRPRKQAMALLELRLQWRNEKTVPLAPNPTRRFIRRPCSSLRALG